MDSHRKATSVRNSTTIKPSGENLGQTWSISMSAFSWLSYAKNQPIKNKNMNTKTLPKGLTRFTYETTSFQGYRVCLQSKGLKVCKYYSDKDYKGEATARRIAEDKLKQLRTLFASARTRYGKHTKATAKKVKAIVG